MRLGDAWVLSSGFSAASAVNRIQIVKEAAGHLARRGHLPEPHRCVVAME